MKNVSANSEQNPQQNDDITSENLFSHNPEKLPQSTKVFRTMSSTELRKFLDGEQMRPIVKKSESDLNGVTTASTSAIWFTPDRAEYYSEPPQEDTTLVPETLESLDFADIRKIWNLGRGGINDPSTNNLMVEFLTDEKPGIAYGKYGEYWVKEYASKLPSPY